MRLIEKVFAENVGTIGQAIDTANASSNLDDVIAFVTNIIKVALDTAGMLAVIILLFAAFDYATAYGDDAKAEAAKKTIFWTIVGLLIMALAYGIVGMLDAWLLNPTTS
ncbi:MAG TPA: hypothetical protein VJK08_00695 [Patescibacteria group bacterium]|nr:hypothetical protein [Patescibacteria group bacterium]